MNGSKTPVTLRSILQRLNRRLVNEGQMLKKSRLGRSREDLGTYYLVSVRTNSIHARDVDPLVLAKEFGVLQPWEELVPEEEG